MGTGTSPFDATFSMTAQGAAPVEREALCRAEDDRLNVTAAGPATLPTDFTGLFGLTVRNDGTNPARQVILAATVPEGLVFVRATDGASYDAAARVVTWKLGDLQPGEAREVAWNGTAQTAGELKAKVRLAVGSQTRREIAWTTRVVEEGAPRPPVIGIVTTTPGE